MIFDNPLYKIADGNRYLISPDNSEKTDRELQKREKKEKERADLLRKLNETIFIPKPLPPANDLSKHVSELKYPADFAEAKAISNYIADTPFCKNLFRTHLIRCFMIWIGFFISLALFIVTFNIGHWIWPAVFFLIVIALAEPFIRGIVYTVSEVRLIRCLRSGRFPSNFTNEQIILFAVNVTDAYNEYEKNRAEQQKLKEKKE